MDSIGRDLSGVVEASAGPAQQGLWALLDRYRNHGSFPSYGELEALSRHPDGVILGALLEGVRHRGQSLSYAELAKIAYAE